MGAIGQKIRIRERLQMASHGYTLYNVSPEPILLPFGGEKFVIPPDGPWDGDPAFPPLPPGMYDGKFVVHHRYGVDPKAWLKYKKERARNRDAEKPSKDTLMVPADRIIEHAFENHHLDKYGVVFLVDDEAENAANIAKAKENWIALRRERATKLVSAFQARRQAWIADPKNAGQSLLFAPQMDDREMAAEAWLNQDKLARELKARAHQCKCGFATDDAVLMDAHLRARHPDWVAEGLSVETAPDTPDDDEPVRRRSKRSEGAEAR